MNKTEKCIRIIKNKKINTNKKPYIIHSISNNEFKCIEKALSTDTTLKKYKILTLESTNTLSIKSDNQNIIVLTKFDINELAKYKENYFFLDYSKLTKYTHYMFPANFTEFNFHKLDDENKNNKHYKGILWSNKENFTINLGDTVYVYYSKIPDGVNRILYECMVIDDGYHFGKNENEICYYRDYDSDDNCDYKGIRLEFIKAFNPKDKTMFSTKMLTSKYGLSIYSLRGKQSLKDKSKVLIEDLEKVSQEETLTLHQLKNRIKPECAFKDLFTSPRSYHTTFEKENGLMHYEVHHLIEQNNFKKGVPENIIYNAANEINLCLNCHKRIHIGKIEDRIAMVKHLYERDKEDIDKLLNKVEKGKDSNFEWLVKQYLTKKELEKAKLY